MKTVVAFLLVCGLQSAAQDMRSCPMHKEHMKGAPQHQADVAAMSDEQRSQYLNGEGMGLAKAAELNHYPGPRHVLDIADKLGLSLDQLAATRTLFDDVHTKAQALGKQILAHEDQLEALFREQHADADKVRQLTAEIANLQGELRALHLTAHVRERALLSAEQVAKYDALRSYVPGESPAPLRHQW
jgi:Spy/CpxP family protein refolding chaperone